MKGKKNNKEKESDKHYIKASAALQSFPPHLFLPAIERKAATQNYPLKHSISWTNIDGTSAHKFR